MEEEGKRPPLRFNDQVSDICTVPFVSFYDYYCCFRMAIALHLDEELDFFGVGLGKAYERDLGCLYV